jgi:hypothetical protein
MGFEVVAVSRGVRLHLTRTEEFGRLRDRGVIMDGA